MRTTLYGAPKVPRLVLPLAQARALVDLLDELADAADHAFARGCCVVHTLRDALAFRVRDRERIDRWAREEAEYEQVDLDKAEGHRQRVLAFQAAQRSDKSDSTPEPSPIPETGRALAPLAMAARRGRVR